MPTVVGRETGPTGFGLMGFTWRANPQPFEDSIKTMRRALALGANSWNGGEIYGTPEKNSLHLLSEYFTKYPEDADKVILSIKGGMSDHGLDGSEQNIRRSIDECLKLLDGKKSLDLFEMCRVDPNTPIETTIEAIAKYVKEGKLGGISLSEVGASTIRRAQKVHPIAAVEVELSMWATDPLTNGITEACAEFGIPIYAYSPLGRGMLTGQIKSLEDIPADDMRRHMPRFQPDTFDENLKLVKEVEKLASDKGATPGQVALAWVRSLSEKPGMPVIIPIPGATTVERVEENMKEVQLEKEDLEAIDEILKNATVVGGRYGGHLASLMDG